MSYISRRRRSQIIPRTHIHAKSNISSNGFNSENNRSKLSAAAISINTTNGIGCAHESRGSPVLSLSLFENKRKPLVDIPTIHQRSQFLRFIIIVVSEIRNNEPLACLLSSSPHVRQLITRPQIENSPLDRFICIVSGNKRKCPTIRECSRRRTRLARRWRPTPSCRRIRR